MKTPCEWCPFRKDVDFRFSPERGEQMAYSANNPYNTFPCHKTAVLEEDEDGYNDEYVHGGNSKECAGFLSLQINNGVKECPDGFKVSDKAYEDSDEMADRYNELDY
jgi:hypothetical protein